MATKQDIENKYKFVSTNLTQMVDATIAVDAILKEAVEKLNKLAKKYPELGFGDTDTSEAIADEFYHVVNS